jgi:hypothetical protein
VDVENVKHLANQLAKLAVLLEIKNAKITNNKRLEYRPFIFIRNGEENG